MYWNAHKACSMLIDFHYCHHYCHDISREKIVILFTFRIPSSQYTRLNQLHKAFQRRWNQNGHQWIQITRKQMHFLLLIEEVIVRINIISFESMRMIFWEGEEGICWGMNSKSFFRLTDFFCWTLLKQEVCLFWIEKSCVNCSANQVLNLVSGAHNKIKYEDEKTRISIWNQSSQLLSSVFATIKLYFCNTQFGWY